MKDACCKVLLRDSSKCNEDEALPFPKTWTGKLILEWLQLKGYLALSDVRLKSGKEEESGKQTL